MSDTKWTPGPWEVRRKERFNDHVYHVFGDGMHVNACIANTAYWLDSDSFSESRANAHLIAAAPELYEALDDCVKQLRGIASPMDVPESATAALKKARGE